jgi:nucleoside-diphosphate-sugar epimerase
VLVTHADEPVGRRVVKTLFHDPEVARIFAVGEGPLPRAFERFRASSAPRLDYARSDLARHRPASDLFHSPELREAEIDTIVHVPRHGAPAGATAPLVAGVAERTAEARLVLQHALECTSVRSLVAVGSAFVYRLPPGNANRLDESSELDLDPDVAPEARSWIDCDMLFHGELHNDRLRVVLLRVPTVVAEGGYVYLHPLLAGAPGPRLRHLGFDPICALVSDKDVARAVQAALHASRPGIYNVAGREAVPLSLLARWTGRASLPVPGALLGLAGRAARALGREAPPGASEAARLRFGFTLDTRRAERELGFRPADRIGLARAGDGSLRLETASV